MPTMAIENEIGTRRQHISIITSETDQPFGHRRCTIL